MHESWSIKYTIFFKYASCVTLRTRQTLKVILIKAGAVFNFEASLSVLQSIQFKNRGKFEEFLIYVARQMKSESFLN